MAGSLAREKKGKKRQEEFYVAICMRVYLFFAGKHIHLGWVDCLATGGGKSAGNLIDIS